MKPTVRVWSRLVLDLLQPRRWAQHLQVHTLATCLCCCHLLGELQSQCLRSLRRLDLHTLHLRADLAVEVHVRELHLRSYQMLHRLAVEGRRFRLHSQRRYHHRSHRFHLQGRHFHNRLLGQNFQIRHHSHFCSHHCPFRPQGLQARFCRTVHHLRQLRQKLHHHRAAGQSPHPP